MSKTKKIFLSLFLALCAICLAFAMTACKGDNKNDDPSSVDPGTETSESIYGLGEEDWYYYEAADTYYIQLLSGTYTLYMESVLNSSGTYTFNDARNQVIFTDSMTGDTFTATYVENFLSLDLGTSGWTFHKYVYFDVTYVGLNGQTVATEKVLNGQPAVRIDAADGRVDKSADGYYFVNWYGDADLGAKYGFDISVTGDTKIYARYILVNEDATVFEVTYDYTSRAADHAGAAKTGETVNNVVFNLPEADGLLGWWVSETNVSDELSYKYIEGETALYADTTLFAVWEGSLGASVTADGVTWETAIGSDTAVTVTDSTGEVVTSGTALSSSGKFTSEAFAALGTGKYTVTVSSGSQTETLVYIVNGLSRVSHFSVEDHVLVYNSVPDATNYYIKIDCGSENHDHTYVDNGTSLVYDFSDCDMPAEGINFVVYAYAGGMYASTSRTYNYFVGLSDIVVTVADDTVSWGAVAGTDGFTNVTYNVYINGSLVATTTELEYSLGGYDKGTSLEIRVEAVAKGYYSEASSPIQYTKIRLATPVITGFNQGNLTWTRVEGASQYEIFISGHENPYIISGVDGVEPATTFVMDENNLKSDVYTEGAGSYEIYIVAIGSSPEENSLKSETITVMENEMGEGALTYKNGVVSWNYVLSAEKYYVQVGSGEVIEVDASQNSQKIEFYGEGETTITVYFGDETQSSVAVLNVTVYSIVLNLTGGTPDTTSVVYLADGDTIFLPDATAQTGYDFAGWYTLPDTTTKTSSSPIYYEGDGYEIVGGAAVYVAGENAVKELYAFFAPHAYLVTLQISGNGYIVDENGDIVYADDGSYATSYTQTVYYDREYALAHAIAVDATEQFYGWFTEPNRVGTEYASSGVWTTAQDTTLISGFVVALKFTQTTYNGEQVYAVSKGTNISLVSEVTVPAYYNGMKVALVQSDAFTNSKTLSVINLPDTVMYISTVNNGYDSGSGAFAGDSSLTEVNIIPYEGNYERYYYSEAGVLFRKESEIEKTASLVYYPYAKTASDYTVPEIVYNSEERDASDGGNVYSVTTLSTQVFRKHTSLVTVTIPATVTTVESQAFDGCTNLVAVTFEGVAAEGKQATGLELGNNLFKSCLGITEITIPSYLSNFDYSLFEALTSLCNVYVSGTGGSYSENTSMPGVVFDSTGGTIIYYPIGRSDTTLTITDTKITKIGENAFRGNTKLQNVAIPAWMSEIGEGAFYGCSGITQLTFLGDENSVDFTIRGSAFYNCTGLTSVKLPANIVYIEAYAFGGCNHLTSVAVTSSRDTNYEENAFFSTSGNCYVTTLKIGPDVKEMDIVSVFGYTIASLEIDESNTNYYTYMGEEYTKGIVYSGDNTRVLYCPASVSDYITLIDGVESVGGSVFRGKNIKSLAIPGSVTTIDENAFYQCTSLATLVFEERASDGSQPLYIGANAFYGCTALTSLELPYGTAAIGDHAFYNCRKIKSVIIEAGLCYLGESAFENCVKLSSIVIGETEGLEIGEKAFKGCSVLSEVALPEGVTAIGDYAFQSCVAIKEFEIGASVESIGNYAFSGCTKLSSVVFAAEGSALKTIGDYAFQNCTSLKALNLPEGVVTLGDYAFSGCSALSEIDIPASVKIMGPSSGVRYVFSGCTSLSGIKIDESNQNFAEEDGVLYGLSQQGAEYVKTDIYMTFDYYTGAIVVPETITTIWESAFSDSNITGVTFAGSSYDNLTIGKSAFSGCASLVTVVLPVGITTIGDDLFKNCSSLTSINVPYTVTEIGKPFSGCTSLTDITFDETPAGVTPVDLTLAEGSSTSSSGSFNGTKISVYRLPERITQIPSSLFAKDTAIEKIYIPSTVVEIGAYAFYSCTNLTEVKFAEGSALASIGNSAFYKCAFESFDMPNTVTTLAAGSSSTYGVFNGCTDLKYMHLSASLEEVAAYAFYGCTALYSDDKNSSTLTIPDSVAAIATYAFRGCSSLESVAFGDTSALEMVGTYAFQNCSSLKAFEVPATVKYLGRNNENAMTASDGATYLFNGCTSLESVTFKTYSSGGSAGKCELEALGRGAFAGSGLTSFSFPETTTVLGSVAGSGTGIGIALFDGCENLTSVYISSTISDLTSVFEGCSSIESMQVAEGSQNFAVNSTYKMLTNKSGSTIYFSYGVTASQVVLDLSGSGVTTIGDYAFYNNTTIVSVTLPATLTYVGGAAFYGCTSLTTVVFEDGGTGSLVLSDGVKQNTTTSTSSLTYGVFRGCTSLISLTLPSNLTTIGTYAFYQCSALTSVNIPSATKIGDYAFYACKALTSLTLPEGLVEIGASAFSGASSSTSTTAAPAITALTIPASVQKIGVNAFENCSSLATVTMQASGSVEFVGDSSTGEQFSGCSALTTIDLSCVTDIPYRAFYGCKALNNINISGGISTICAEAFSGCTSLSSIVLSDGLTSIEAGAFSGCTALVSINIPYTVTKIGSQAFSGCSAFRTMTFSAVPSGVNSDYTLTFAASGTGSGVLYGTAIETFVIPERMATISDYLFCNIKTLENVSYEGDTSFEEAAATAGGYFALPEGIKIGEGAFYGCTGLKTVDLSGADPETGKMAFYGCSGITAIVFNEEATEIADGMFYGCSSLRAVSLPENLLTVGDDAFGGCSAVTEISVPASVETIGAGAFRGMSDLTTINFETISDEDVQEGEEEKDLIFVDATATTSGTFYGTSLIEITIPARTTSLSDYMFYGVTTLGNVTFEDGIQIDEIPQYAFSHCTSLKEIAIPEGVETIGSNAFACCYAIGEIEIPYTVTYVGGAAFYADDATESSLTAVSFADVPEGETDSDYPLLFVSENSNSGGAFGNCANLVSITLPNRCVGLGAYMFYKCNSLEEIYIPSAVTCMSYRLVSGTVTGSTGSRSDAGSTFAYCYSLKTVQFGTASELVGVGTNTFLDCTSLEEINLQETKITVVGNYSFQGCTSLKLFALPDTVEILGQRIIQGSVVEEITLPAATTELDLATSSATTFLGATSLKNIYVADGNPAYKSKNGMLYTTSGAIACCPEGNENTEVTLEEGETIGTCAFLNCTQITSVNLPDSLTEIPDNAFNGCTGLTEVVIPDGVTTISGSAYTNCTNIEEIYLGKRVSAIGSDAFSSLTNLDYLYYDAEEASDYNAGSSSSTRSATPFSKSGTSALVVEIGPDVIRIPNYMFGAGSSANACQLVELKYAEGCSLQTIGEGAFYYCQKITSLTFPESLVEIENKAFYYTKMTTVTIPASLQIMGSEIFRSNTSITTLTFEEGVTEVGESMFYGCTGITAVEFPSSMEEIGYRAFYGCYGLATITFNDGLRVIGEDAFNTSSTSTSSCKLTSLTIPSSVEEIGKQAFNQQVSLTSLTFENADGGSDAKTVIGEKAFYRCSKLTAVAIPGYVEEIGTGAFTYCTSLASVTFGEGLRIIDEQAFSNGNTSNYCPITTLSFPGSLEEIGKNAFLGCRSLTSVTFNEGLRIIGEGAFSTASTTASYSLITEIKIPASVEEIGAQAFYQQLSLATVTICGDSDTSMVIESQAFYRCSALTSVTIPGRVKEIGSQAFAYCTSLTSVALCEGLEVIGESAFSTGASSNIDPITSLEIPASVETIGATAFAYCTQLTTLTLKDGLVTVGDGAFKGCSAIGAISLPSTLVSIGSEVFYGCTGIGTVAIPGSVETVGDGAFGGMTGLTCVTIPVSVKNLGSSVFSGCSALTNVTMSCDLTEIPSYLFYGCTSLGTFALPSSCEVIGEYAFAGCTALTAITYSDCIQKIGAHAFDGCTSFAPATLPATLLSVGAYAFSNTGISGEITLPDSLEELGEGAFSECASISGVKFNSKITTISDYLFKGCGFTSFTIPDSVAEIGEGAFSGCASLTSFTFNGSVAEISAKMFQGCTALESIQLADQIKSVGSYAFDGCTALTQICIGANTTGIGEYAFNGCTALASFDFKGTVTSVGDHAFEGCTTLSSVSGSSSVKSYGTYVFQGCALTNDAVAAIISTISGIPDYMFYQNTAVTAVVLGDNIVSVGQHSFDGCAALESLTIGENVSSALGAYAFNSCTGLKEIKYNATRMGAQSNSTSNAAYAPFYKAGNSTDGIAVTVGANVLAIPDYLFYATAAQTYAPYVKTLVFEEGAVCESIGVYAFGYTYLESAAIPASVTTLGNTAFRGCSSLTTVTGCEGLVAGGQSTFYNCTSLTGESANTIMANLETLDTSMFYGCSGMETITIPNTVTTILQQVFYNCIGLKYLTIGEGVETMEGSSSGNVFYCCKALEEIHFNATNMNDLGSSGRANFYQAGINAENLTIYIGANVTRIPAYCFYYSSSTNACYEEEIIFEKGSVCEEIGKYAFGNGSKLTSVVIPETVTSIGEYAFNGCSALTTIYYGGTAGGWSAISIGSNNSPLSSTSVTIYYYAETSPTGSEEDNFWHWDEQNECPVAWAAGGDGGDGSDGAG